MKKDFYTLVMRVTMLGLTLIFGYLIVASLITQSIQRNTIKTYSSAINSNTQVDFEKTLNDASKYNSILYQTKGMSIGNSTEILSDENYNNLLNLNQDGIMGSIEIPKINVNLPIYHGVSDEVLQTGIGHLQESSLPVGGENTRAVLTGHRGLPSSKLFDRIDELSIGDFFFVKVCDETLAYQVITIEEILPTEVDKLNIVQEKDLISLVTCTPYGINTHRLIVTGERVEYNADAKANIKQGLPSARATLLYILPRAYFIVLGIALCSKIYKKFSKKGEHKKDGSKKD